MDEMADLKWWLREFDKNPRIRVHRICERAAVQQCQRGCMRAALSPCINACIEAVANPASNIYCEPYLVKYVLKCRDKILEENKHRPPKELAALQVLTNNCLRTCVPHWTKRWKELCKVFFKRICIRICTAGCKTFCKRSCRLPCLRTPLDRLRIRDRLQLRIGLCLIHCIGACVNACLRGCRETMPQWLGSKARHMCRPVLTETSRALAARRLAEDIVKERKMMTDKCNVLNGCRF